MLHARRALLALASVITVAVGFAPTASASTASVAPPASASPEVSTKGARPAGYWLADDHGAIFSGGGATFHGSTGGTPINHPIVGIAATPSRRGYWMVATDGGIFSFGDAAFHGSTGGTALNKPIVGMASTPSGRGYWLVASDGGIFAFGDAAFHGSTGATALNKPIVGMASTPSGKGYWLVASDGGIFAFGDAAFHGSTGAIALNKPIVGIAPTPSGHGYWMAASDGGIFSFGDAHYFGSTGSLGLNMPIVGMASTPTGHGYWFAAADGGVFTFGDAHFYGSATEAAGSTMVGIAGSAPVIPTTPPAPPTPPASTARKLAFTTQPSATSTGGDAFVRQPVVKLQDASGATVPTDTSAVTLHITAAGQQTFACTSNPKSAVAGVATFAGCNVDSPGSYTLTATDGTLTAAVSTTIVNSAGAPTHIAFAAASGNATSLVTFGTTPTVFLEDRVGNTVTTVNTGSVTLSLKTPVTPAGAALTCTNLTAAYVNGQASFPGCHIDLAGTYRLHIGDGTFGTDGTAFNVVAAAATHIAFTTQPGGAAGAVNLSAQPVVTLLDASDNTVTTGTGNVVLSISQPSDPVGAALTCTTSTTTVALVQGVATFAGCSIDLASTTTYTLQAVGPFTAASAAFAVTVGGATHLAFVTQPSSSTGGVAFATQPHVAILDAGGNVVVDNPSPVSLDMVTPTDPAGAVVACTTNPVTPTNGIAIFAGCLINRASTTTYQLHASVTTGLTDAASTAFAIAAGPATHLGFVTQPIGSTGGVAFPTQPRVAVQDAGGNTVPANTGTVTLTITQPSAPVSAALTCTSTTLAVTAGLTPTFAASAIDLASTTTYTLLATYSVGGIVGTSVPITIAIGPASHLTFLTSPSASTGATAFTTQPQVTVKDAGGNTVSGANTGTVTLTLNAPDPAGAALTCTTSTTRTVTGGVTPVYAGCAVDLKSTTTYTLLATYTVGPITGISSAFAITVGAATQLRFTQQPVGSSGGTAFATQPIVAIQDAGGNTVTSNASPIALSITQPSAPLGAALTCTSTTVTPTLGSATFAACTIDLASTTTYTLLATVTTGPAAATSNPLTITIGAAVKLGFTVQPSASTGGTAFPTQPRVAVQDAGGNTVVGNASPVTLSITQPSNPVGAALSCPTNPVTPTGGIAVFSGCTIDLVSGTTYTLLATVTTGPTAVTSAPFAITIGAAVKLGFVRQPVGSTGGTNFATQPRVAVQDAGGNVESTNTSPITLSISQPSDPIGAALTCTTNTVTPSSGVATFTGCQINLASTTTYSLLATLSTGPASATSNTLTITVGAASQLVFTTQASATTANGVAFAQQPVATVEDAGGNTVKAGSTNVTLTIEQPSLPANAILTCTSATPVATVNGVAVFTGCSIDQAGTYALQADDGALSVESAGVTIT